MHIHRLSLLAAVVLATPFASAAIVDFNNVETAKLPYSEDGLTFTNTGQTNPVVVGRGDGYLASGTNVDPIGMLVTGSQPFDLTSIAIERLSRKWVIEASSGATFVPSGTGTIDFSGLPGWKNLTSFEFIHNPPEGNGSIQIDDITFTFVPEPATGIFLAATAALAMSRRRIRGHRVS